MENANQDGQARLDKYYKDRLEFNREVCRLEQELKQFKANRNKETIMPLLEFLEQRIPTHLRHKVLSRFSFTEEDSNERSSLLKMIEERTFASIGMLILRNIPLTKEEIVELNEAWSPVVGISPDLQTFHLGGSELSRNINKKSLDALLELGRRASGG